MAGQLLISDGNVNQYYHDMGDGKFVIQKVEDVSAVIESNKRAANATSKASKMGEWVRVGCIPATVLEKWCREDGINYLLPEHSTALMKKMEQPDNRAFKTHVGRFA